MESTVHAVAECDGIHTIKSLLQNSDEIQATLVQLTQFRQQLHESFPTRADAIMDLLDALCSNTTAQSVAELSLNPVFRYSYNSVYDGIQHFFQPNHQNTATEERCAYEHQLMQLIVAHLPLPQQHPFWLFGVDVTSAPRRFAYTLADRTYVYQPNTVASNKPVTIGHQYSALVLFPEKTSVVQCDECGAQALPRQSRVTAACLPRQASSPPWVVPLSLRRVSSKETKRSVGAEQVKALLNDETLPFHRELCVQVADSDYSVVYYAVLALTPRKGHPTWYGKRFDLKDKTTWRVRSHALGRT